MSASAAVTWGFIGAGGVARRQMLPAARGLPGIRLGAVMVRDQARAEALAAEFGAAAAYDTVDALLADRALDAVYIATPPNVHPEQVEAAAAAGKHVLLEKPMALSVAECDRMLAATEAAGVQLAVCFPLRHTPALQLLRQWVQGGELGELTYVRAQLAKWYPLDQGAWRADPAQSGGGVLMDLGSHLFDLACFLGGPVASITAQLATRAWPVGVDDTATVALRFTSGALGLLDASFAAHHSDNRIEVYGTAGAAWTPSPREVRAVRRVVEGREEEVPVGAANVYATELLDFSAALREERPPATTGRDGRANTACLEAAYRAARSGQSVSPAGGS